MDTVLLSVPIATAGFIFFLIKRFARKPDITWPKSFLLNTIACSGGVLVSTLILHIIVPTRGFSAEMALTTLLWFAFVLPLLVPPIIFFTALLKWRRVFYLPVGLCMISGTLTNLTIYVAMAASMR